MAQLDVRLDDERRRRLEEIADDRGLPIAEVALRLIDDAYEEIMLERRREAVNWLVALEVEAPLDPDTLSQKLEAAHEPGGLSGLAG